MKKLIIILLLCSVGFAEQIGGVTGIFKTKLDDNDPLSSMLHENITIIVNEKDDSGININFEIINNGEPLLKLLNNKKCNSKSYSYNAECQSKTSFQLLTLGLAIYNGKCYTDRGFIIEGGNVIYNALDSDANHEAQCILTVNIFDRLKGKCRNDKASARAVLKNGVDYVRHPLNILNLK